MQLLNTSATRRLVSGFLKATEQDWLGVLLFSHADLRASQGRLREPDDMSRTEKLMKEIADRYYLKIRPMMTQARLITGNDIMDVLDLKPGAIHCIIGKTDIFFYKLQVKACFYSFKVN